MINERQFVISVKAHGDFVNASDLQGRGKVSERKKSKGNWML